MAKDTRIWCRCGCVYVYWEYVCVFGVSAGCASACWLWSNVHNIFSSARMQLNMHCLLTHTLRPHVHTHVHPDTAAHTLTQISSHVRTRLVAFALLDFHLCHHIARISLCTFWGQIVFLFQSPEWGSWFPVITPYILIFICQHSEGSSKKYEERSVSAEGSIPLWFIEVAGFLKWQ